MLLTDHLALLACLVSTSVMAGVIGFVQVVHYPLFAKVGPAEFVRYHAEHCRLTAWVVAPPMLVELVTSLYLAARSAGDPDRRLAWSGLAAAVVSWGVTGLVSVPLHNRLAGGYNADAHRALVRSNAARVVSWNVHVLLLLVMTERGFP